MEVGAVATDAMQKLNTAARNTITAAGRHAVANDRLADAIDDFIAPQTTKVLGMFRKTVAPSALDVLHTDLGPAMAGEAGTSGYEDAVRASVALRSLHIEARSTERARQRLNTSITQLARAAANAQASGDITARAATDIDETAGVLKESAPITVAMHRQVQISGYDSLPAGWSRLNVKYKDNLATFLADANGQKDDVSIPLHQLIADWDAHRVANVMGSGADTALPAMPQRLQGDPRKALADGLARTAASARDVSTSADAQIERLATAIQLAPAVDDARHTLAKIVANETRARLESAQHALAHARGWADISLPELPPAERPEIGATE